MYARQQKWFSFIPTHINAYTDTSHEIWPVIVRSSASVSKAQRNHKVVGTDFRVNDFRSKCVGNERHTLTSKVYGW